MSSGFKKQLLQSQAYSGTTKKGDVVVLPPDSEDVILVTKCSGKDSGVVKATLEHSPDKEDTNFSIVQSEKVSTSSATTGWGNLKYLDTTATGTGSDYKNKTVKANNLSGQSHDIFHDKMTKDDPWTISTWIKSNEQPETTVSGNNTKYIKTLNYSSNTASYTQYLQTNQHPWGNGNMSAMSAWSVSFWMKWEGSTTETNDDGNGYVIGTLNDEDGTKLGWVFLINSSGDLRWYFANSAGNNITGPTYNTTRDILTDGNWHFVCFTHKAGNSHAFSITGSSSFHKLWVDGVCQTPTTTKTGISISYGSNNPVTFGTHPYAGRQNALRSADISYDEIAFWDVDLADDISGSSSATITAMYNLGVPADESSRTGLLEYYKCGDTDGDTTEGGSAYIKCAKHPSNTDHKLIPYYYDGSDVRQQGWTYTTNSNGINFLSSSDSIRDSVYTDDYLPVLFSTGSTRQDIGFGVTKYLDCNNETNKSASFEQRMRTDSIFWDSSASATLFKPNGNWSVSFWFKYTDSSAYGIIWDMRNPDDANKRVLLYTGNTGNNLFLAARHGSGSNYAQEDYGSTTKALLLDGSWHHVVITNAASSTSTNGTMGSNTTNMKLWIDGVCKSANGTDTMGDWGTTTDNLRMTFGHYGTNSINMNNYYPIDHGLSNVSTWTVDLASDISGTSSDKISALYNSGDPTDLTNETGLLNWFKCGDAAGDNLYDASDATNAYLRDSKGTAKLVPETTTNGTTFSQGWSNTSYGTLVDASSETIAVTPSTTEGFGNGMRMSFTKKLKTDATWELSGAQTSRFLLSFDGFENTSAYFLGYNTTFTRPLHPKTGVENASADLLDGEWHNIIVSYRGGAPGTAVNPHDYIAVCFDGKQMTATDCVEKTSTVTFINDHFRYTDVSEDLRGTFFLSAGAPFVVANTNSKYAFQGGFDETSLHTDSWQLPDPNHLTGWSSGGFNTMKPNTIYGIDSTRNSANDAGSPYDLKNPSTIGHPGPTGNSYIEPSASAVGGGLQAYYRWGDTTGDCSTSIHDVQSAIDGVTDRDLAVLYSSISAGDATDENSAAWDTAVDTVAEGGIEVASTSIAGSAGFALENVQITCADGLQFFRVNAPKLSNLRIKWTGAGTATSVEASIHYRRRKK